jgi:hypothetical protein
MDEAFVSNRSASRICRLLWSKGWPNGAREKSQIVSRMKLYRRIVPDEGRSSHLQSYSRFHKFLLVHHDELQVIRCSFCCSYTLSGSRRECCPPLEHGWSFLYGLHAFRLCWMLLRSQLSTSSSFFFVRLEYAKHDG